MNQALLPTLMQVLFEGWSTWSLNNLICYCFGFPLRYHFHFAVVLSWLIDWYHCGAGLRFLKAFPLYFGEVNEIISFMTQKNSSTTTSTPRTRKYQSEKERGAGLVGWSEMGGGCWGGRDDQLERERWWLGGLDW